MNQFDTNSPAYSRSFAINVRFFGSLLFFLWMFLISGCATLHPDFVAPSVNINSFKPLASESFAPRFEIGMRVVNPNAVKLNLRGMSYKIFLNGYQVLDGAASELPEVPAYGEAEFKVIATVGLVEGMRFVSDMLHNARGQVDYRLQARLDVGAMIPTIQIEKTGNYVP